MTKLYITSIETDFNIRLGSGDPKIFNARVYCKSDNGVELSFSTNMPAQYHVGDIINMTWTHTPTL